MHKTNRDPLFTYHYWCVTNMVNKISDEDLFEMRANLALQKIVD